MSVLIHFIKVLRFHWVYDDKRLYIIYINIKNIRNEIDQWQFNPLLPIAHKSARIGKISILKLEGIILKISFERRDYESVDEKKPILGYVSKNYKKKKNSDTKGLNIRLYHDI